MNSELFNLLGIGNLDPAYLFIAAFVLILVLLVFLIVTRVEFKKLERKYNKFMQGKEAQSLEDEIVGLFHDNRLIRSENEKNRKDIIDINKRMARTLYD